MRGLRRLYHNRLLTSVPSRCLAPREWQGGEGRVGTP